LPFLIHAIKWEINIIAIDHVIKTKVEKAFLLSLRHDIYTMWARGNLFWANTYCSIVHVTQKVWLMAYGDSRHFQKYFSFIDGGNRDTKRKPPTSHWQTLSQNVISSTPRQLLVVIGTYWTLTCKSIYHTITATTPFKTKQSMKTPNCY
jgi:hypothetical protein